MGSAIKTIAGLGEKGISTPEDAAALAGIADGIVIGSAYFSRSLTISEISLT
jgi:tryptophan synthase alpha subunit